MRLSPEPKLIPFHFIPFKDVEIIAIDPNSFYSSGSSSDSDEDVQGLVANAYNSVALEVQPPDVDFDVITLNIDDDFPIDDDILFKNDHHFDLATYISDETNSLLLSPVNQTARNRLMSISDFAHIESVPSSMAPSVFRIPNAAHDKVAKTPASNRRKRKNISPEFIETSDSDEETKHTGINSGSNDIVKQRKDDDPVWMPSPQKPKLTARKPAARQDLADVKNVIKPATQGKGLRKMLKQQMLSDRPLNKSKFLKTTAEKRTAPTKKFGVGRGKDIEITAKYYNCNEQSDSERDTIKPDRFHQIYTDSESDSDVDVHNEASAPPKVVVNKVHDSAIDESKQKVKETLNKSNAAQAKKNASDQRNVNKVICIDSSSLDSTDFAKALATNAEKKTKPKTKQKVMKKSDIEQQKRLIQSNLLLQNPAKFKMFATDTSKSMLNGNKRPLNDDTLTAAKQPLIEATINKTPEIKCKPAVQIAKQETQKALPRPPQIGVQETSNGVNGTSNGKQENLISKQEASISKHETSKCQQEITNGLKETNKEIQPAMEYANDEVDIVQEDSKPDVMIVDESKAESCAKRKLNLQEYLKRKSLNPSHSDAGCYKNGLIVNIKTEATETQTDQTNNKADAKQDAEPANVFIGNSMYEEIIIVSMGCNTDISIPELSFIQPSEIKDVKSTVLLSDIQTSVEKANSKISSCSLISSIQEVILKSHNIDQNPKKDTKTIGTDADASENNEKTEEHGENKVIMHLRKDRVRPMRVSTSIQTEPYFQFPPLEKLAPRKQLNEKRMSSVTRENRFNEISFAHNESRSKNHRNYRGPSQLSESSYYSDEEDKTVHRRSRHSEFMEKSGRECVRRESSRYSASKYDRFSRQRTISRSLSSSSDNSTTSTDSSSSSSSNTYISSSSPRSLNSYGGSSSKSYYVDDHQYYRKRSTSNNSRHKHYRSTNSNRSNSPGKCVGLYTTA